MVDDSPYYGVDSVYSLALKLHLQNGTVQRDDWNMIDGCCDPEDDGRDVVAETRQWRPRQVELIPQRLYDFGRSHNSLQSLQFSLQLFHTPHLQSGTAYHQK